MTLDNHHHRNGECERCICINRSSLEEHRDVLEMIKEVEDRVSIPIFEYSRSSYIKTWHKARTGDNVLYCLDGHGIAQCRIALIRSECFPPEFVPYNQRVYQFAHYVHQMFPDHFGYYWLENLVDQQIDSVNYDEWLFATYVVMTVEKIWQRAVDYMKRNIEVNEEGVYGL